MNLLAAILLSFFAVADDNNIWSQADIENPTYKKIEKMMERYRCALCHDGWKSAGGIDLRTHDGIVNGKNDNGVPVIVIGQPDRSIFYRYWFLKNSNRMPLGGPFAEPNDPDMIMLRNWILKGAK